MKRVCKAPKAITANPVCRAFGARKGTKVIREIKEMLVHKVLWVLKALKDNREKRAKMEARVRLVRKVQWALEEMKARKAQQALKDRKD